MDELTWFLPHWPPAFGNLMLFGVLLAAGLLGGEIVNRIAALPRITGYVLVGVAAIGVIATLAPTWRATRINPVDILRQ